jgi:hypothetical protein
MQKNLASQWFRNLGCPRQLDSRNILGPFRRGVSRFRRFAFRFRVLDTPMNVSKIRFRKMTQQYEFLQQVIFL